MSIIDLLAVVVCGCVGFGVWRSNPKRDLNRAFSLMSIGVVLWLLCVAAGVHLGNSSHILVRIRITCAISSFFPWLLWIVMDCAGGGSLGWRSVRVGWPWLLTAVLLAALTTTTYFIPADPGIAHLRGPGWSIYYLVIALSYVALLLRAIVRLKSLVGIQRIETQTLLLGGACAGILGVGMSAVGTLTHLVILARLDPLAPLAFYILTARAITAERVFDARYLFESLAKAGLSAAITAVVIGLSLWATSRVWPFAIAVLIAALLGSAAVSFGRRVWVNPSSGPADRANSARAAILSAGQESLEEEVLIKRFSEILGRWGGTRKAHVLRRVDGGFSCDRFSLAASSGIVAELSIARWATPERVIRRRETDVWHELGELMRREELGAIVCGPDGSNHVAIALDRRFDQRPYTWPDIQVLQELAAMIEGSFERTKLREKARDSERLVTAGLLGVSLAHEIRNPMMTIKLITAQVRSRCNDPKYIDLMENTVPGEVERILTLVTDLIDLGRPRELVFETVDVNQVIESAIRFMNVSAADEKVDIRSRLEAKNAEIQADKGRLQQILSNLILNAVHAAAAGPDDRWVEVTTRDGRCAIILEVADSGLGVPASVRQRLFRPFVTEGKTKGIGLGLANSADIVHSHRGTIVLVDEPPKPTTFRVTIPWQQPS